jgi:hypothetical protein
VRIEIGAKVALSDGLRCARRHLVHPPAICVGGGVVEFTERSQEVCPAAGYFVGTEQVSDDE